MVCSRPSPFHPLASLLRLCAYIRLLFQIKASSEGLGSPLHNTTIPYQVNPSIPEFDHPFPTDPAALCGLLDELARHLQSRVPGCEWLEEGAIKFVGDRPIDVGEVANIFVGMRGNRKVAVKCYRFYPSLDYLPSYMVRVPCNSSARPAYRKFHR